MKYAALVKAIHSATAQMQGRAAVAVNQALILRNWLVGEWILEFEHHGKDRAKYGEKLLDKLAADLKQSGLKGLDMRTLRDCRGLVRHYPQIRWTVSPEFLARPDSGDSIPRIPATLSPEFRRHCHPNSEISPLPDSSSPLPQFGRQCLPNLPPRSRPT